jgi:hypothetical protein
MRLTVALAVALVLCGGSLVARASILQRQREAARPADEVAERAQSEQEALAGVDFRIHARLRRLAR